MCCRGRFASLPSTPVVAYRRGRGLQPHDLPALNVREIFLPGLASPSSATALGHAES